MNFLNFTEGTSIPLNTVDLFTFIPILVLVGILFYLSNREMKKSLEQSRLAQKVLLQDRVQLQSKLDKSLKELRENRLKRLNELTKAAEFGRLSQGIFHDLMTPLTSVILHTERLKGGDATQRNLDKAVEAGRRMAEYAKEIRTTLSHEETERECLLHEELESMLTILSYKARKHNVSMEIAKSEKVVWTGNPLKIRQIFSNLISNAIDAFENIEKEHKKVEISIKKKGIYVVITIEDNGSGISQENISKIFDPFFTTKSLDMGTGIGLTTVKSIVEKDLGGSIEVESRVGRGSIFTVTFPV